MKKDSKKFRYIFFLTGFAILFFLLFHKNSDNIIRNFDSDQKEVRLTDSSMIFELASKAQTVEDFLNEQKISLGSNDGVLPEKNVKIFSGTHIIISRAKNITIKEAKKTLSSN